MIGNYDQAEPTQAILNSVAEIAGWKAAISNIDPRGYADLRSGGFSGSKFAAGQIAHVPVFHGHRDLHYHTCPGNYTVQHWNEIRNATYKKYQAVKSSSSGTGSWVTRAPATLAAILAATPAAGSPVFPWRHTGSGRRHPGRRRHCRCIGCRPAQAFRHKH